MAENFEIIYKELKKIDSSQKEEDFLTANKEEASPNEINEIAELRRMVLELNESEPHTYTSS